MIIIHNKGKSSVTLSRRELDLCKLHLVRLQFVKFPIHQLLSDGALEIAVKGAGRKCASGLERRQRGKGKITRNINTRIYTGLTVLSIKTGGSRKLKALC